MKVQIFIYILNEGGFRSLDKDGFLSYEKLGMLDILQSFITKRLEHFGYKNYSFIRNLSEIKINNYEYSCVINMVNPFVDSDLILKMASILKENPEYESCRCEGAVPGTEPDLVFKTKVLKNKNITELKCLTYTHNTQSIYNNQFNLRKLKRVKMFSKIINLIEDSETLTISELIEKLHDDKIFEKLVSYFEDVKLEYLEKCPCCNSELQSLFANVSQSFIGYIPQDKPWYYQCIKCKLIMLSPYVNSDDAEKLYDFYNSESQGTAYFLRRGARYAHYDIAISMVQDVLPKETNAIDLGCGSGAFIFYIKEQEPSWNIIGCDLSERVKFFKEGQKNIEILSLNFLKDDIGTNKYDLITAWEVIEHIPFSDVKMLLHKIHKALKPNGIFLFSTPDFDSPLSKMFDFYALCPPHHPLVFSKSWMNYYFKDNKQFKILKIENESAMLEIYESWFSYWMTTSKHFESRETANFMLELLREQNASKAFHDFIKKKEWGTDMIVALQKK